MYVTLERRKQAEVQRREAFVRRLCAALGIFAIARHGRYVLYGSAAKGCLRHDSDIDLLVDFPPECEAEAWRLAETLCADEGVALDIQPLAWPEASFVATIMPTARII